MQTAVVGATIFTGTGDMIPHGTVLIERGRIASVGPDGSVPRDATVLDADGLFLMAGFIDAHTHLALPDVPERREPHPSTPFLAARAAREKLASGVTTVRDVAGNNHVDLALRAAIRRGDVHGPTMLAAGKAISATGGHIHYWAREADGPDAVRQAVREQIKAGADLIKLMLSGGSANVGEQPERMQLQPDEIRVAVLEAREAGRRVAAHAHPSHAICTAAEAGVASIEHGAMLDDAAIEALLRHDVVLVPTQAVYQRIADNVDGWPAEKAELAQGIMARKVPALRRAIEAGVKIGVGTDSGRHFPSGEITSEMLALEAAGMPREQVLRAVTRGNADLLGLADAGTVEPGRLADLVLLGRSPLEDLAHARDVRIVLLHGQIVRPVQLQAPAPMA